MAFTPRRIIGPRLYRDAIGHVLRLPSGIICVPFEYAGTGRWNAVVIGGDVAPYESGCWHIAVYTDQIDDAERIKIG